MDPLGKLVHIEGNKAISYGKCLIASGSKPRLPEFGIAAGAPISTFHTVRS